MKPAENAQSKTHGADQPDVGIAGALWQPLKIIDTDGGPVLHMLRAGSPLLPDFSQGFGEIYFSEVLPGAVKAWKRHSSQTQHFAVPSGLLRIVLYDERAGSPSQGALCELLLGRPAHYGLLRIPVGIWYGFTAVGPGPALICNCADKAHDPAEGERRPPDHPGIPYTWAVATTLEAHGLAGLGISVAVAAGPGSR